MDKLTKARKLQRYVISYQTKTFKGHVHVYTNGGLNESRIKQVTDSLHLTRKDFVIISISRIN